MHAALLADADPAVDPARGAARAGPQRDAAGGDQRRGDALTRRRLERRPVHLQLDHEGTSSTVAKRSGENQASGSGVGRPAYQVATSSPVAGASPMPAPSCPVATQMFG